MLVRVFALLALIVATVNARFGVDLSVATDQSTWNCLLEQGMDFAKVRAYRSTGQLDSNAPTSLKNAYNAGLKDLDAYIFPCISTSPYSLANNITCTSATQQLTDTVKYLADNGIYFYRRKNAVFLNRMWMDIEDENPSKYFDPDTSVNLAYMAEITDAAKKMRIPVGIYTTKTYWNQIMNNTDAYSGTDRLGRYVYPLWYPRYDGVNSMDFFEPFAGWESVMIKQTGGDVGYCGISQVDSDYMEDNTGREEYKWLSGVW